MSPFACRMSACKKTLPEAGRLQVQAEARAIEENAYESAVSKVRASSILDMGIVNSVDNQRTTTVKYGSLPFSSFTIP